jgi:hypothetical protein
VALSCRMRRSISPASSGPLQCAEFLPRQMVSYTQ